MLPKCFGLLEKTKKQELLTQMLQTEKEPKTPNPQHPLATAQSYRHTTTQSGHGSAGSAQPRAAPPRLQLCTCAVGPQPHTSQGLALLRSARSVATPWCCGVCPQQVHSILCRLSVRYYLGTALR